MDHMMPKMDGIEATKIIRDTGYDKPIVALTANAVSGQADIFLGNGFDDFISKPIDIRQLNNVLNKMIRDKHPEAVALAAKRKTTESQLNGGKNLAEDIDSEFIEIFIRDALKSLAVLDAIDEKKSFAVDEDLRTYIIHIHGIKSALANIGNMELSAVALKLEMSARDNDIGIIKFETPAFLDELKAFVEKLKSKQEKEDNEMPEGDPSILRERLFSFKTACEDYDEYLADNILTELKKDAWPQTVKELLGGLAEYLLHSDFDLAVAAVDKYLET
jgi:response regulator RpfG family c-di-GMP phosphodiesterase